MRYRLLIIICSLTLIPLTLQSVHADSDTDISIEDFLSVDEAVARITEVLERKGFEIVLVVNHAAAAESVELELRPTQVIFARPPRSIERSLLKRSPTIGIDLPLKYLVFEDAQGMVHVTTNPAGYLMDRHAIRISDPLLRWLRSKADRFGEAPYGLVTIASRLTFEDTIESLKAAIPSPPFRIPLELDYAIGLNTHRKQRSKRLPFLLVFGNPLVGTPLMQSDQRIGIDLPQKFLIWEDRGGGVFITWNDPFFIAARYGIQGQEARLRAVANALNNFAQIGAGN